MRLIVFLSLAFVLASNPRGSSARSGEGAAWEDFGLAGKDVRDFAQNGDLLYAGTYGAAGVYRRDLASTGDWVTSGGPRRKAVVSVCVDPTTPTTLYAGVHSWALDSLFKSIDGGGHVVCLRRGA